MQYTVDELNNILDLHHKWIHREEGGKRAYLAHADLQGANLKDVSLEHAVLRDANLIDANLCNANLRSADLSNADLTGADLERANLEYADLRKVSLVHAHLTDANLMDVNLANSCLTSADLNHVNLKNAYLWHANLRNANLNGANLWNAELWDVDLWNAQLEFACIQGVNLTSAQNVPELVAARTSILPEGDIIGWKKLKGGLICKLRIPANARRSNANGRKCRAEFAEVLEIWDGNKQVNKGKSSYDENFVYRVGEIVFSDSFSTDRWDECAPGIHFFISKSEAEQYVV